MRIRRRADHLRDDSRHGVRGEEVRRVIVTTFIGHQLALHRGVDAARVDAGDPQ
jgi:hypothetical protein